MSIHVATDGYGDDVAEYCDLCNDPIGFHEDAVMRGTGEVIDGWPVVVFLHQSCSGRSDAH